MRRSRYRYQTGRMFPKIGWVSPFPFAVGVSPRHFKCPLPQSDAEFAILSEIVFGKALGIGKLWLFDDMGQVEIAERYDDFAKVDGHFTSYSLEGYDRLSTFMQTVFGSIACCRSLTYQDFRRRSHRQWRRMEAWERSRRRNDSRTVRPAFVRLADRFGVGENTVSGNRPLGIGVLSEGRADGATAASIHSAQPAEMQA